MLAFIVVALATVVIFQALTLLRPTYVQTSLYRELLYGSLVILLPTFIIGYLGWVLFHWHFPAYGVRDYIFVVLYDKFAFSTVLGVALGITIGVLLNSITLAPLHRPLTTKHKLLIGLAATLLFLGIGGERLSYDVARSVSKLSFGGVAEVSFFDRVQQRRSRPEGDPSLIVGIGDPVANGPAISLEIFSLLPGFIYRDTRNIEAAASRKNQDADAGVIDALHQADSLAQIMVAPFGDCQFEIFKVWGDLDFLRTNLALLLPPFRDLAPRAYRDPQRFSAKGALATTLLFQRLFIFAYEHAYVYENKHLKLNERDRHPGSKRLASQCRKLAYVLCSPDSWAVKRARVRRMAQFERKEGQVRTEEDLEDMSAETFKLSNTAARLCYRTALQSIDGRSGRVRSNFELQIAPILQKFAANSGFEKRPYTAIMLAAIFAQLGLYDSALAHLDDWIRRSEGSSTEEKWLKVRALNIALYLSEYWVRKDGANASIVLRDFHIQRQKQVLALVDDLFDLRSVVRQFRHPVSLPDFSNTAFSRPPRKQTTALARI